MKKLMVIIILLLISIQVPAFANAITSYSGGGDKVTVGGDVKIDEETSGSVVTVMGNANVDKDVNGSVVVVLGDVTINARVSGSVIAVLGKITLTDKAVVDGSLISIGSIEKDDKAQVNGQDVIISTGNIDIGKIHIDMAVLKIISLISFICFTLIFGIPMLAIFSKTYKKASIGIDDKLGYKLSIGFLGLLGIFILTILLAWTVLVPIVFFFLIIMARVATCMYFGRVILNIFDAKLNRFMEFFTGLMTIIVIKMIIGLLLPSGGFILFGLTIGWDIVLSAIFDLFICSLGLGILINVKLNKNKLMEVSNQK